MFIIVSFLKKKSCQVIAFQNQDQFCTFLSFFFVFNNSFFSYKLQMQLMQSKSFCEFTCIWFLYFIKIKDEVLLSHETDFCFHSCNSVYNCQSWLTFQNTFSIRALFSRQSRQHPPCIHQVPCDLESHLSFLGATCIYFHLENEN